jgi:hypothetical protein
MDETKFTPRMERWVFYNNINNYTSMHQVVRNSYRKLLFNRNNIKFDSKNKEMLRYDDKLREIVESELYKQNIKSDERIENDTYLFVKHLIFIDDDKIRCLHKKIRYEIFDREVIDNIISDDEEYEVDSDIDL